MTGSRGWPGKYIHGVDKTVTGIEQRKGRLSGCLSQEVPRLDVCFWVLSENVLERGQYLNYWTEEKQCDHSRQEYGLLAPAPQLCTRIELSPSAHTLQSVRPSLPPQCMAHRLIISQCSSISYWFSCSRESLHRNTYHRTGGLRMR